MEASEPGQQGGRILLIDDDAALGGYLVRVLRRAEPFEAIRDRVGPPPPRAGGERLAVTP